MNRVVPLNSLEQFAAINVLSDPGHDKDNPQVPNCMNVVIQWGLTDGKTAHNVLHARYPAAYPGTVTLANAFLNALTSGANWTALQPFLNSTGFLQAVLLRDIAVKDQPVISSAVQTNPGTGAGSALPDETAVVVTLRTALTGPGNRGRVYIPNWNTSALGAGNVVAGGAVTALQNYANAWIGIWAAQNLTLCLALPHRKAYTGTGTPPKNHLERLARTQDVTSTPVRDNHWDTIRRRGLK